MLPGLQESRPFATDAIDNRHLFQRSHKRADAGGAQAPASVGEGLAAIVTGTVVLQARDSTAAVNIGLPFAAARQKAEHDKDVTEHQPGRGKHAQKFVRLLYGW